MTAVQAPGSEKACRPATPAGNMRFSADLTESMMRDYGHRVPLEVITRIVHDVLDDHLHPRGAQVTEALTRETVRRLRALAFSSDHPDSPPPSGRAEVVADADAEAPGARS